MRAFIDTSALIKKYINEEGTEAFEEILEDISEISVSPTTYVELLASVIKKCSLQKSHKNVFAKVKEQIDRDYAYFHTIAYTREFEQATVDVRLKYELKSLDLIQLTSAGLSHPQVFITSDKQLYKKAKLFLKKIEIIKVS